MADEIKVSATHIAVLRTPASFRLPGLQVGRGIAATLVVLYHAEQIFRLYFLSTPTCMAFAFGHAGVDFFFVLSGFIMMWIHRQDIGVAGRLPAYAMKRFRRVYIPYWVVLGAVLPAFFIVHGVGHGSEPRSYITFTSLTLLPNKQGTILSVAWTLSYEIFFYALFASLIWRPRFGWPLMGTWILGGLVTRGLIPWPLSFVFSRYTLHFALGMLVAWTSIRNRLPFPGAWTLGGVLAFGAIGAEDANLDPILASAGYAFSSAIIVAGITSIDLVPRRFKWPNPLLHLGDASYSLYLVHYPVLSLVAKGMRMLGFARWPHALAFVLLFVFAIASGIIFHVVVERRLLTLRWPSFRRVTQVWPPA